MKFTYKYGGNDNNTWTNLFRITAGTGNMDRQFVVFMHRNNRPHVVIG